MRNNDPVAVLVKVRHVFTISHRRQSTTPCHREVEGLFCVRTLWPGRENFVHLLTTSTL